MTGPDPADPSRCELTGRAASSKWTTTQQRSGACLHAVRRTRPHASWWSASSAGFARAIRCRGEVRKGGVSPPPSSIVHDHAALHLSLLHQLEGVVQLREGQAPADHLLELILPVHEEV